MRKTIALSAIGALAAGLAVFGAAPAMACTAPTGGSCGDTTATFTVTAGSLSIAAPTSVALSNSALALTAGSVSGTFGTTTVTDTRGGLGLTGWTVSVSSTDFTTPDNGGGTITKSNGSIYSGAGTIVSGLPVLVATTLATPVSLASAGTLLQATSATGSNQVTYTPTLSVTIPTNAIPGNYTGVITQSVQ
jgi:hypothetical protein